MMQGAPQPTAASLVNALRAATTRGKFSTSLFFNTWFQSGGLYFLFRKNLAVTNIQYSELLALLRQHSAAKEGSDPVGEIAFSSPADFKELVGPLAQQLIDGSTDTDRALQLAVELYAPVLQSLAVVRPFYGSCVAYFPAHIAVDLVSVCGLSGYIHSCGPVVYIRHIDKAKKREFFDALDSYLVGYQTAGRRPVFAPFAHEDFSPFDKERPHMREDLRHGLDDVKLDVEKMNMGVSRLVSVLEEMRTTYGDRLDIPPPGDYRLKHPREAKNTLWLVADSSVGATDLRAPGKDRYLVSYDQWYYNDSPFAIFDENKPAWVSHTTIPHTLFAAMLNVTKPWRGTSSVKIADPFAGTGTAILEAAKESQAVVTAGDINPVIQLVIGDNLAFFGLAPGDVESLQELLTALVAELKAGEHDPDALSALELFPGPMTAYRWARRVLDTLRSEQPSLEPELRFSDDALETLRGESLGLRVVFYVCLRAWIRSQGALYRGSTTIVEAFRKSACELIDQLADYSEWARRARRSHAKCGNLALFAARYSDRCGISPDRLETLAAEWNAGHVEFRLRDATELESESYDIVATDPPYGFNTDEELLELAELYRNTIRTLVRALKDRGHLVLSLPSSSRTGRPIPAFTRSGPVVSQILTEAREAGMVALTPATTLPAPRQLFMPPYYWNSEKALTRTILHFQFIRLGNSS
jgi:16S rRNA G966 N2-methylase RsmD